MGKTSAWAIKGIVYYTDNQCQERILLAARKQLLKASNGIPIVSVSQYPIDFGHNIVHPVERSIVAMFEQIIIGLKYLSADIIFFAEHDVLYHPSHFDFVPERKDAYYFNTNVWTTRTSDGQCVYHDHAKRTSGLVAYKDILIEHYTKKVEKARGYFKITHRGFGRKIGFEPGAKKGRKDYEVLTYKSKYPNVDIKHGGNITPPRFKLSKFQHGGRRVKDSFILTDSIPSWGRIKGRFDDFIREVG